MLLPTEDTFSWQAGPGSEDLRLSAVSQPTFYTMYLRMRAVIYSFLNVYWKLLWARHGGGSSGYTVAMPVPTLQGSRDKWGRQSGDR